MPCGKHSDRHGSTAGIHFQTADQTTRIQEAGWSRTDWYKTRYLLVGRSRRRNLKPGRRSCMLMMSHRGRTRHTVSPGRITMVRGDRKHHASLATPPPMPFIRRCIIKWIRWGVMERGSLSNEGATHPEAHALHRPEDGTLESTSIAILPKPTNNDDNEFESDARKYLMR